MKFYFHSAFEKKFRKLKPSVRSRFLERLKLMAHNPFHPQLNNHALKGKFQGYRSVNVTGDIRAIYKPIGRDGVEFDTIGTHSELYS